MKLQSDRLVLREVIHDDFDELREIFQDIEIMYAWEHAFSDEEIKEWINKNIDRYKKDGFSYFAATDKISKNIIGVIGILSDRVNGENCIEVAYILNKKYWGMGYAHEGAKACIDYAFKNMDIDFVMAEIRPENKKSSDVAKKLGMKENGYFIKRYNGKDMKHIIYKIKKNEFYKNN